MQKQTALASQRLEAASWGAEAVVCLWAWLIMAGCLAGLALHAASGHVARADLRLLDASRHFPASLARLVHIESQIGEPGLLVPCIMVLALALFVRRAWLEGIVALSAFGVFGFVVVLKHVVAEVPPYKAVPAEYVGVFESNYSFPSGHVAGVSILFGLAFVFADRLAGDKSLAFLIRAIAFIFIATVGPGRIWLQVHYPSDVIASYLLTAMFLLPVWFCCSALRRTMRRQDGT